MAFYTFFFLFILTCVRPKPLLWFRFDTKTETQNGRYFWADTVTNRISQNHISKEEISSLIVCGTFYIIKGTLKEVEKNLSFFLNRLEKKNLFVLIPTSNFEIGFGSQFRNLVLVVHYFKLYDISLDDLANSIYIDVDSKNLDNL